MTSTGLSLLAGIASTVIFAASVLPMVVKAWRTRDLRSYSRGHLVLANVGNGVHSVYVWDLPPGPIWALHSFYVVTSALMLAWSIRYRARRVDMPRVASERARAVRAYPHRPRLVRSFPAAGTPSPLADTPACAAFVEPAKPSGSPGRRGPRRPSAGEP